MTDTFTVYAYDLNTNTPLAEIPANNLRFSSRLNDAGNCSFDVNLTDPRVKAIDVRSVTTPWQVALYIDRDGVLVWGGIVTGRNPTSARTVTISGREFLTWTDQRTIAANYDSATLIKAGNYLWNNAGQQVGAIDPAVLIENVFNDAAGLGAGASIGITVPNTTTNLPLAQPGYQRAQNTPISQIVNDITGMLTPGSGGLDVAVVVAWGAGNTAPTKTLQLSAPRSGRIGVSSGIVFDLAKATAWSWPEDGTQYGTDITVTGATSGSVAVTGSASTSSPVGGLGQPPRLDLVLNQPNLNTSDMVQKMANAAAVVYGQPLATPKITFPTANPTNPLGTWVIGDDARVIAPIGDEWFPTGLDEIWRIVGHTVSVNDEGVMEAEITLNVPPVY